MSNIIIPKDFDPLTAKPILVDNFGNPVNSSEAGYEVNVDETENNEYKGFNYTVFKFSTPGHLIPVMWYAIAYRGHYKLFAQEDTEEETKAALIKYIDGTWRMYYKNK